MGYASAVISSEQCSLSCCSVHSGLNCTSTDPSSLKSVSECYYNNRLMRLLGDTTAPIHPSHYPSINESNSIVGRFKALLVHLSNTSHTFRQLSSFLDDKGELLWNQITVAGHSCASYYPLLLATLFPVKRLVMIGGVGGSLTGFDLSKLTVPGEIPRA